MQGEDKPTQQTMLQPCVQVHYSPAPDEFGTCFVLLADRVVVGRDAACAIKLQPDTVSRKHALLTVQRESGRLLLELEQLSGHGRTEVETQGDSFESKPGKKCSLQPCDKFHLGSVSLEFTTFPDLHVHLRQTLNSAVDKMRRGEHQQAQTGFRALDKYKPVGGDGASALEQILRRARYYTARIDAMAGKWSAAAETFGRLLGEPLDAEERVKIAYHSGIVHLYMNDLPEALRLAEEAKAAASGASGYLEALALCLRGMVEARSRRLSEALQCFQSAAGALETTKVTDRFPLAGIANLSARIVLESAIARFLCDKHHEALAQLELQVALDRGTPTMRSIRAEALRYRGIIRSVRRDFTGANSDLSEAYRLFHSLKIRFLECKAQKSLALNYLSWGRLEDAEHHLQQCAELLATEVENPYEQAVVAGHLGKVCLSRGNATAAMQWFERERAFQAELEGIAHSEAYTHRNFARAHRDLDHGAEAVRHFELAAEGFAKSNNPLQSGLSQVELANQLLDLGDVARAEAAVGLAEGAMEKTDRGGHLGPLLDSVRARIAGAKGQLDRSTALFESSLTRQAGAPPTYQLAEAYLHYGRARAEKVAHHKEALKLFKAGLECAQAQNLERLMTLLRREIRVLDPVELVNLNASRFLGEAVVRALGETDGSVLVPDHPTECTMLFVDLSGYTAMVERMELDAVKRVLNEFFGAATRIVTANGGKVMKFIGDCVLAVFQGPTNSLGLGNQAVAAAKSAQDLATEVDRLSERLIRSDGRRLMVTAGMSTGHVLLGCFGTPQQMDFTVIGDAVNVAARLQSLAKPGEIVLSSETYRVFQRSGKTPWVTNTSAITVKVKNREQPVDYWLLDRAEPIGQ